MDLKELARDAIALGGFPFMVLVLVRIAILDDWSYFSKIFLAVVFFVTIVAFTNLIFILDLL